MADPLANAPGRLLGLLLAIVVTIAAIGFSTGMSSSSYRAKRPLPRERVVSAGVPPARTHAELERNPWTGGPDASGWQQSLAIAAAHADRADDAAAAPDRVSLAKALVERAARRAFDGAPPVVPHPVRASGAAECLACHADGFVLGSRRASAIPHAAFASCMQCHVSASGPFEPVAGNRAAEAPSRWSGLSSPDAGEVAYAGAPPAVPHSTRMRERCESCHGENGRAALRTPHPERQSCLQCHPATGGHDARASR